MTKFDEIIQRFAPGNNVDLGKLAQVQKQLDQLERAGTLNQTSGVNTRPLGNPFASTDRARQVLFANAALLNSGR
jgi:hypothetical protein